MNSQCDPFGHHDCSHQARPTPWLDDGAVGGMRFIGINTGIILGVATLVTAELTWARFLSRHLELLLAPTSEPFPHDAIGQRRVAWSMVVVPSYRLLKDGTPSALLAQRIELGVQIAASHRAALLFSGGVPPEHPETSDAMAMLEHARRCYPNHVSRTRRVLLENRSHTTRENAVETLALMQRLHLREQRLIVVTNRFHQRRACGAFERAARSSGVRVVCASAPSALDASHPGTGNGRASEKDVHRRRSSTNGQALTPTTTTACSEHAVSSRELLYLAMREHLALFLYWIKGWL